MKLTKLRVQNYRCVIDSDEFQLGQITCLVGKNESGKTSLLRALERFNSLIETKKRKFDRDQDWPRNVYADYNPTASVLTLKWELEDADVTALEKEFGSGSVAHRSVDVTVSYDGSSKWTIPIDKNKLREHLFAEVGLEQAEREALKDIAIQDIAQFLSGKADLKNSRTDNLIAKINSFKERNPDFRIIEVLEGLTPKILYFDSFDRMPGRVPVEKLKTDKQHNRLPRNDEIFLNFLESSGTSLEEISSAKNTESLYARFEGASNNITRKIFQYWRQNKHLGVKFSVTDALPEDPAPYNSGKVFQTRIENRLHGVTVNFDERSAGFTWFFSFLVQFAQIKKKYGNVVILLDEPGLNLHGKAQSDLLRFIKEELVPKHQVIYTTHSPFMVPPDHLEWVRTVEDVVKEDGSGSVQEVAGTKVAQDVFATDADTLFPLQAALGYEITQSLSIGPNNLLVEGPSDMVYLIVANNALRARGSAGLDTRWTLVPSGGVDKVGAFISLFGGNKLNVAVLTDYAIGQKNKVESLKKSEILQKGRVFTVTDFTGVAEGDIEDMWGEPLFCGMVNHALGLSGTAAADPAKLPKGSRVMKKIEDSLRTNTSVPLFNHFTCADWLLRNPNFLLEKSTEIESALQRFQAFFDKVNVLL
jgi:energy-coupling factor transporter ATP-binding protein EcfA2